MNISIVIVVSGLVVLTVALVLFSMFGAGMAHMRTIAEAANTCKEEGRVTCDTVNMLPLTWFTPGIKTEQTGSNPQSCADVTGCETCSCAKCVGGQCVPDFEPVSPIPGFDEELWK
ncbi:MAG: hypothetical protein DRO99_02195 [Candidatus Aenigmatarchaeota archaeon]|nr:MAG: hypothetical protein DRO99_02195 [Candidatus Aenigmarchaeota archaeon]